jgi:hypothetical protein
MVEMNAPRRHLTVRNLPADVARAIDRERKRRGESLNATVVKLLRVAVGSSQDESFDNGLGKHAGGWSERDLDQFQRATAVFEEIDDEAWR